MKNFNNYIYYCNCDQIQEEVDIFDADSDSVNEEIQLFQCPKETINLLLEYLLSSSISNSYKIRGSLIPFNRGCSFSYDEFISLLRSLSISFIKLAPVSPSDLLSSITGCSVSISFIDYQLRYINSLVKECLMDEVECSIKQKETQIYEEKIIELRNYLLNKTETKQWKDQIKQAVFDIIKIISDIFKDQEYLKAAKLIEYLSI